MTRTVRLLAALAGVTMPFCASAQDNAGWIEELRELRKMVETQNKKIDALTAQVSRLSSALDGKPVASAPAAGETGAEAPRVATAPAHAPGEFSTATAPRAEPAVPQHVIMKGETLTSVAKLYNVSLSDLMKVNKGLNDRKLQIGQSINLPVAPKTSDTTTSETKANP